MTEPPTADGAAPAAAPAKVYRNWVERWRAKCPEGSWRRFWYDKVALPVWDPTDFTEGEATVAAGLMPRTHDETKDAARAAEILAEAQAIYRRAEDRASGAETRATTLQGAVAIAASLLLAGASFVVGGTELQNSTWRVVFAVFLVAATVALVFSGVRALSATSTIHPRHVPTAKDIIRRSQLPPTEARVELAAETLVDYSYNTKIAAWKVSYLGAAAWWFRIALALLLALALLVGVYAVFGPAQPSGASTSSSATTTQTASSTTSSATRVTSTTRATSTITSLTRVTSTT